MFKGIILTDCTNLFSPRIFKKNGEVFLHDIMKQNINMSGPTLDNPLQFIVRKIKEIEELLLLKPPTEKFNKYNAELDYAEKTLPALSIASSGVSPCSFANFIGTFV